jgi:hypothetical protein
MKRLAAVLCFAVFALAADKVQSDTQTETKNAIAGVEALRSVLNDPDSLVVERIYANMNHKPDKPTICIAYRARNLSNGYLHDVAQYSGKKIEAQTLGSMGWCAGIERNREHALSHGWADITDEYQKQAAH